MGRTMARVMLALVNDEPDVPLAVVLPTELVVRESA
jgi:DNA-binding LacI/PurR family transcriptional regulator